MRVPQLERYLARSFVRGGRLHSSPSLAAQIHERSPLVVLGPVPTVAFRTYVTRQMTTRQRALDGRWETRRKKAEYLRIFLT
jgi:hypothetical protein